MSKNRTLIEAFIAGGPDSPALKIDREAGIIYGVKVLGRFSKNSYQADAPNGTEYSLGCMRAAAPLYENLVVRIDHPPREKPDASRSSRDGFGRIRNVRIEDDGMRADLHYLKAHQLAPAVTEDIERRLGVYGLSHNAVAGRERLDKAAGRLVVEELVKVRSVDLVDKPATTRNLWESHVPETTTTLRELLEARKPKLSAKRGKWLTRLLEDDGMSAAVAAPLDAAEESADPDDALWNGFKSAINAVLGQYEDGDVDAAAALAKVKELLTTHEKLGGDEEPDDPPADPPAEAPETPADKTESERAELAQLRREKGVRELCEAEQCTPTRAQFKALVAMEAVADRRELIADIKATAGTGQAGSKVRTPRSGRNVSESTAGTGGAETPADLGQVANQLRGH